MSVFLPINPEDLTLMMTMSEAREKFLRLTQYVGLFMEWFLKTDNAEFAQDFRQMSRYVRFGRKILLFGKSLSEIPRIRQVSRYANRYFLAKSSLLVSRAGYMLYYLTDNLTILGKIGFINKEKMKTLQKISFTVWMVGITSSLFYNLVFLRLSYSKELGLRSPKMLQMLTPRAALKITTQLSHERHYIMLNIFRNLTDMAIVFNKMRLSEMLLRTAFNDGLIGICGITSSAASIYQFYFKNITARNKKKKMQRKHGGKHKEEHSTEVSLLLNNVFE